MPTTRVDLPPPPGAPDGACPTHVMTPDGPPSRASVVLLTDIFGVRPAILALGERLAREGHVVAIPDWLHRTGAGAPPSVDALGDAAARTAWIERVRPGIRSDDVTHDVAATLAFLDARAEAPGAGAAGPVGIVGYCLGGRLALVAAARLGARIGAVAAYHPGHLVTGAADSPHALASGLRARVYVGAADDDPSLPPEQLAAFGVALTDAGVPHTLETYAGARHGFVPADMPAHDPAATARHWASLRALFDTLAP